MLNSITERFRRSETPAATSQPATAAHDVSVHRAFPSEHAAALLAWLQGPGGRTGMLTAAEVRAAYLDMLTEADWSEGPWNSIARELRRLLGDPAKRHATIHGRRYVVYAIPRAGANVLPFQPANAGAA